MRLTRLLLHTSRLQRIVHAINTTRKLSFKIPFTSAEPKVTLHCNLLTVVFHEFLRKILCYVPKPPYSLKHKKLLKCSKKDDNFASTSLYFLAAVFSSLEGMRTG
jgi:hypothetical protein